MKDFPFFFDSPSDLYVQRMECVPWLLCLFAWDIAKEFMVKIGKDTIISTNDKPSCSL
jgi:hypothetical protein